MKVFINFVFYVLGYLLLSISCFLLFNKGTTIYGIFGFIFLFIFCSIGDAFLKTKEQKQQNSATPTKTNNRIKDAEIEKSKNHITESEQEMYKKYKYIKKSRVK